jgi:hypothetical protein
MNHPGALSADGNSCNAIKPGPAADAYREPNGRNDPVTRSITLQVGAAMLAATLSGPVFAQGAPQTVTLMKVDPQSLATGFRVSKVVGATVVNDANVSVGTIDDLIVTPSEKVPYAVLSVGGFLGIGSKYVVVPFNDLQISSKQITLPGATKDSLTGLPAFKYNTSATTAANADTPVNTPSAALNVTPNSTKP